ncbi:DUF6783 domain-containing protein [Blautia glucerasea]
MIRLSIFYLLKFYKLSTPRVCLKNHSRNLHAPLCGRFCRKPFSDTL